MRKMIGKLAILGGIFLLSLFSVFNLHRVIVGAQYQQGYQASVIDKVNRLASIEEPKIILVGNSNVAFGIQSELIEAAFDMPVVNLGLHGGLGNALHEQIAKLNINKGDVVIICHSSFSKDDSIQNPSLAWTVYDYHAQLLPMFRAKDILNMTYAYPDYFRKTTDLWISKEGNQDSGGSYSRNAFNEYGDVVCRPAEKQLVIDEFFQKNLITVPEIDSRCVSRINKLNRYVSNKGARLVVAGYPIAYGEYATFTYEDFDGFQRELEKRLDCPVISKYSDYFYPYEYFYDTILHLTEDGARARTQQLVSDLKSWGLGKECNG